MAVQKKSLVSTLNTTKTANIAGATPEAGNVTANTVVSTKAVRAKGVFSAKKASAKASSMRKVSAKKLASTRAHTKASFKAAK